MNEDNQTFTDRILPYVMIVIVSAIWIAKTMLEQQSQPQTSITEDVTEGEQK